MENRAGGAFLFCVRYIIKCKGGSQDEGCRYWGAGFIGSHLVDELVESGHEVHVIDNLSSGYREYVHPKAYFHLLDIREESCRAWIHKEKPALFYHLAAQADVQLSLLPLCRWRCKHYRDSEAVENLCGKRCPKVCFRLYFRSLWGITKRTGHRN
ncbi:NAD-dependent epimerase/dehydratase family protein [Paenibacillus larvae]|nr:NAD-dependent epimerase/dehydratase family protein [Paenibacillus larvae]MDT2255834.1 NAD-dependent epimerase/dehydratase family protein [Paenibacillus larvae]